MDKKIVDRILTDESTQTEERGEASFSSRSIHSRVGFAIALSMPATVLWLVLLLSWFRAVPSFTINIPTPVLFGLSVVPLATIEIAFYLNGFLRKRHKLVAGGVYGSFGILVAVALIHRVLTGAVPPSMVLLSVLFAFAAFWFARGSIRSHYRNGAATWASDE